MTASVWDSERQAADRRAEIANEIFKIWSQFECQKQNYDKMTELDQNIDYCKRKNSKVWPLLVSIIWAAIYLYLAQFSTSIPSGDSTVASAYMSFVATGFLTSIALLPLVIVVVLKITRSYAIKRDSKKMGELYDDVYKHYLTVKGNPFAFEYSDPYSLFALYEIVRLGKADTAKEAVNVLEQSRYQSAMLNIGGQTLEAAQGAKNAAIAAAMFSGIGAFRR
ncbi:hypothetical protein [Arabiibacter massiliensis]|uniref:hypothetical protein n=1 Tax=Arabiibacter massiliensis TaxID=1870985 RepID=UPI001E52B7D3|nr:hypothetical protein [Arabiibacter massiliensis]